MSTSARHLRAATAACVLLAGCGGTVPAPTSPRAPAANVGAMSLTRLPGERALISGTIHTPERALLLSAALIMVPIDGDSAAQPSEDVRIQPDGTFVFRDVKPGRYQIRARGETEPDGVSQFATYTVIIDDRDMHDIDLVLLPGADIRGTLVAHASGTARPQTFTGARVRLPFRDGSSFGDTVTGDVSRAGAFRIRGALGGAHVVTVEGLPAPWVVERVTLRGEDITDAGLACQMGERVTGLTVTITDTTTEVGGLVRDAAGSPVPAALVVVAPLTPRDWPRTSRYVAVIHADAAGRYAVRGLPPGLYRAIASSDLEPAEAYRAELLRAVRDLGRPAALDPNRPFALDLALTAADTLRRAPAR